MKKRITREVQIVKVLKEYEGGRDHAHVCSELGIHKTTFITKKEVCRYGPVEI